MMRKVVFHFRTNDSIRINFLNVSSVNAAVVYLAHVFSVSVPYQLYMLMHKWSYTLLFKVLH